MSDEPIWIKRMALGFEEWARQYKEDPTSFGTVYDKNGDIITDYGYLCAKYFDKILRDMDKAGMLPRAEKVVTPKVEENKWQAYTAR